MTDKETPRTLEQEFELFFTQNYTSVGVEIPQNIKDEIYHAFMCGANGLLQLIHPPVATVIVQIDQLASELNEYRTSLESPVDENLSIEIKEVKPQ